MGYTVYLASADLRCRSEADARRAAAIIRTDRDFVYHFQVTPVEDEGAWSLEVRRFEGDQWEDDAAERVWLALASHMADGASIELQGEDRERWRIRWQEGKCYEDHVKEVIWSQRREITPEDLKEESP